MGLTKRQEVKETVCTRYYISLSPCKHLTIVFASCFTIQITIRSRRLYEGKKWRYKKGRKKIVSWETRVELEGGTTSYPPPRRHCACVTWRTTLSHEWRGAFCLQLATACPPPPTPLAQEVVNACSLVGSELSAREGGPLCGTSALWVGRMRVAAGPPPPEVESLSYSAVLNSMETTFSPTTNGFCVFQVCDMFPTWCQDAEIRNMCY